MMCDLCDYFIIGFDLLVLSVVMAVGTTSYDQWWWDSREDNTVCSIVTNTKDHMPMRTTIPLFIMSM